MNRNLTQALIQHGRGDLSRETAIHEAGHAAAIYLGNQQRQLPAIFFQICIKRKTQHSALAADSPEIIKQSVAKVEGGRLIHTLPSSFDEATKGFSVEQKQAYQLAFEADIINLLVGPLAEAKYVALRDDEPISQHLIPLQALHYYGGTSDLEIVRKYLECFIVDTAERATKSAELFCKAFSFISQPSNWWAIVALADYLLDVGKDCIDCKEASVIIDNIKCF
jgi:hypothetical protein